MLSFLNCQLVDLGLVKPIIVQYVNISTRKLLISFFPGFKTNLALTAYIFLFLKKFNMY